MISSLKAEIISHAVTEILQVQLQKLIIYSACIFFFAFCMVFQLVKHRPHTIISIFLHMLLGFLTLFFAISLFTEAERFSLALRFSGIESFFTSHFFLKYLGLVLLVLSVLIIASSITRSRIYFERETIFGKTVAIRAKGYRKGIDDKATESLTLIAILALAYAMIGPTFKSLLSEITWSNVTTIFFMSLCFAALISLAVLITKSSIAYLAAMYEVHRETSRRPLGEIPEIEEFEI